METRRNFLKKMGAAATASLTTVAITVNRDEVTLKELQFEILDQAGVEELPAPDPLRSITGVPSNYQDYITPEAEKVTETADKAIFSRYSEQIEMMEMEFDADYIKDRKLKGKRDVWIKPSEYLETGKGDCEDYALAIASVLEARDTPARFVLGEIEYLEGEGKSMHAVTETTINGEKYVTDVHNPKKLVKDEEYRKSVHDWNPLAMFSDNQPYQIYDESFD